MPIGRNDINNKLSILQLPTWSQQAVHMAAVLHVLTWFGLIVPGHQAKVGSLIPPSNVVSLPHKNGPLLPPVYVTMVITITNQGWLYH